jgi:hypothetical protein
MTQSTYTTDEVGIERAVYKLYGMAIARITNKAVLAEVKLTADTVMALLYRQWNEDLALRRELDERRKEI